MRVIRRLVVQPGVDRRPVFSGDIGKNGLAVADRIAAVNDIGKLAPRRLRCIEYVLVPERHAGQPQERKDLQAVAIIVGDTEQCGIGVEREHRDR
jgi:hypothetical protein